MNQMLWIALAAIVVLAALVLIVFLWRNWQTRSIRGKRLGVLERLPVSRDAELLLIRRDGTEHLLCLSGQGGFLVEANIRRPQPQAEQAPAPPQQALREPAVAPPHTPPPAPQERRPAAQTPPAPPPGSVKPAPPRPMEDRTEPSTKPQDS